MTLAQQLEISCLGDPLHFSPPLSWAPAWSRELEVSALSGSHEWELNDFDVWRSYRPMQCDMPSQGWKLHVSTTVERAQVVLNGVSDACIKLRIPFKHVRTTAMVAAANARSTARASSGKSIAVYPSDVEIFQEMADELASRLDGEPGPYVISDRRWSDRAPVYFRYGAFLPLQVYLQDGRRVPALWVGSQLVEDSRKVPFRVPEGVHVPPALASRTRPMPLPKELPVHILETIQHSSCGGVYRGKMTHTGQRTVIKEARPFTGGTPRMEDALIRLEHEASVLHALDGCPTPRLLTKFTLDGHLFVAAEEIPGENLRHWVARCHPQLRPGSTEILRAEYVNSVSLVMENLENCLSEIHSRGWAHNDLHPGNVIVRPDLTVALADFEFATGLTSTERPGMDCAGFALAEGMACQRDEFGFLMIKAWALHPGIGPFIELAPEVLYQYAEVARSWFGNESVIVRLAADRYVESGRRAPVFERTGHKISAVTRPPRAAQMLQYLERIADPSEHYLFPGDAAMFSGALPALAVENGSAGILLVLVEAGREIPASWVENVRNLHDRARGPMTSPGMWDGWSGVALLWAALGDEERARSALAEAAAAARPCTDPTLRSGLAGFALAQLALADLWKDSGLRRSAERVLARLAADPDSWGRRCQGRGLLEGPSGVGMCLAAGSRFLSRGDWQGAAQEWVERDVRSCKMTVAGSLEVPMGNGAGLPYLGAGSLGVALAREQVRFAGAGRRDEVDAALVRAGCVDLMVEPGLVNGRMGISFALSRLSDISADGELREWGRRHIDALPLYSLGLEAGVAIVGRGSGRLSADFATGTAGAAAVLRSLDEDETLLNLLLGLDARWPPSLSRSLFLSGEASNRH